MSETCKVVFFGELQKGVEAEQVIEAFSEKFGVSRGKAEKLLNAGRDVVLKGGLDDKRAKKYQKVLEKIGLVVRIEGAIPAMAASGLALEPMDNGEEQETEALESVKRDKSAGTCPKCGSSDMQQGVCQDCGVVAEKYQALQSRLEQTTPIELAQVAADNPYSAPEAELLEAESGEMTGPINVSAGHSWAWLVKGWWHFKQNPFAWILALVVWFILAVVTGLIPLLGSIAINLITPVITAGFFIGARAQDEGEDFTVGHLFAGFSNNPGQLLLVGVIYFGAMILLTVVMMGGIFGMIGLDAMAGEDPGEMLAVLASPGFIIALLLGFLLFIPLMMAYIFAPALVALDDFKALEAMRLSFSGCLKNLLPLILYFLIVVSLLILGFLPFGLGLLIVLPVLTASLYSAYQDIYYS